MKIISNKLYEEYTKEVMKFHQPANTITKEQLYEVFKFHCANQRVLNETVDYLYSLVEKDRLKKKNKEVK